MKEITMRAKELNELLRTLSENRRIKTEEMPELLTPTQQKETVSLKQLSEMFGVPLWTLRSWAAQRKFDGLIKIGRRIYVDVSKFRSWFMSHEVKIRLKEGK